MISTLFSSLNIKNNNDQTSLHPQPQPILIVLEKTMPIFKQICDLFSNDTQVIEVSGIYVEVMKRVSSIYFQF